MLLVGAVAAHALEIDLQSHGNYTLTVPTAFVTETVVFQDTDIAIPALTSLSYSFARTGIYTGSGAYTNGVDTLPFTFTFTQDTPTDGFSFTQAAHGIWNTTGGAGVFAGLVGSGVISANFHPNLHTSSLTEFSGTLAAVPEPASYAVFGLGLVGLVRRKRK